MKIYPYVNKLGVHKFVEVSETPDENGLYSITGWSAENGEMCFFDNLPKEKSNAKTIIGKIWQSIFGCNKGFHYIWH